MAITNDEEELCSKYNLLVIKELVSFTAETTNSSSQLVKARKILALIENIQNPPMSPAVSIMDYI